MNQNPTVLVKRKLQKDLSSRFDLLSFGSISNGYEGFSFEGILFLFLGLLKSLEKA